MVADPQYDDHRRLWQQAHDLTCQVEEILQGYPEALAALEIHRDSERYTTPRIPEALERLAALDPAAHRRATALWKQADTYRWQLVQTAVPAIQRRIRHLSHPGYTHEDWMQEGLLGAYNGALRWDANQGGGWVRFAADWAYARAQRAYTQRAPIVPVPQNTVDLQRNLSRLQREAGERLSDSALAEALSTRPEAIRRAREGASVKSIELPEVPGGAYSIDEVLPADLEDTDEALAEEREKRRGVAAALAACMDERERRCIRLRFGLDGGDGLNYGEIGDRLGGLSRERVRQIIAPILHRAGRLYEGRHTLEQLEEAAAEPFTDEQPAPLPAGHGGPGRPPVTSDKQRDEIYRLTDAGYTQKEIAEMVGISQSTISVVNRRRPMDANAPRCPIHINKTARPAAGVCGYCQSSVIDAARRYQISGTVPPLESKTAQAILSLSLDRASHWRHADTIRTLHAKLLAEYEGSAPADEADDTDTDTDKEPIMSDFQPFAPDLSDEEIETRADLLDAARLLTAEPTIAAIRDAVMGELTVENGGIADRWLRTKLHERLPDMLALIRAEAIQRALQKPTP